MSKNGNIDFGNSLQMDLILSARSSNGFRNSVVEGRRDGIEIAA